MKVPARVSSVILWSVISAAFIGPGTITTAITSGSLFHIDLLWAVLFATIACIVLQEISARITIGSGMSFGRTLATKYGEMAGRNTQWMVALPVLMGCAAYEAGNILGAVSGLSLLLPFNGKVYTILCTLFAGTILWSGGSRTISLIMTMLVGAMGMAFLFLALQANYSFFELLTSVFTIRIPAGAEWLTLALVGTTIVPYNIFIGSAISKGHTLPLMRLGLIISVTIGGMITAWIMIAGSLTGAFTSFDELALRMTERMGDAGRYALGIGLFAAGFSSTITSPYAASLIASTVLGSEKRWAMRAVWMTVLFTGFLFGVSGVRPIPVILAVQALNGFVLPLLTYFLIMMANEEKILRVENRPGKFYNFVLIVILGITLLIGLSNVDKAIVNGFHLSGEHGEVVGGLTVAVMLWVTWQLGRR
jgi:manganese transport protein